MPGRVDTKTGATMIDSLRGWWQRYRRHRRHHQDIQAFNRLMDARAAARRGA